jgi:hypothetical protein
LVSSNPTTITFVQSGNPLNTTTYTTWNEWVDSDNALEINETITVSSKERYHTIDIISWVVNSPINETVNYFHQYLVTITTSGLDAAYPAIISFTQHGSSQFPTTSASWSQWVDTSSDLSIFDTITASINERFQTNDMTSWVINSALTLNVDYIHQYKPTIISNGLSSEYPATINFTHHGIISNSTTFISWSNWSDASTGLYITGMIRISERERFSTLDTISWTLDSPFSVTVNYIHQYKPIITLEGTDDAHTVGVIYIKDGANHNDSTIFNIWSEWADENTTLSFDEQTSGTPKRSTTDKRTWTVVFAIDTTISYDEEIIRSSEDVNYKPLIALIFSIILLIVGTYVSYKKPLKIKEDETKNKLYTWFIVTLPFIIVEATTGILSLFIEFLSIPPLMGAGMVIDLTILIAGLIASVVVYRKP